MQSNCYRIDVGRWTLSRANGQATLQLEPDPLVFEPIYNPDAADEAVDRAVLFRRLLRSGEVRSRAELARQFGLSRARVTQILGPMNTSKKGE